MPCHSVYVFVPRAASCLCATTPVAVKADRTTSSIFERNMRGGGQLLHHTAAIFLAWSCGCPTSGGAEVAGKIFHGHNNDDAAGGFGRAQEAGNRLRC
jgi:hypothetical protein